jgi:hypothetical protein
MSFSKNRHRKIKEDYGRMLHSSKCPNGGKNKIKNEK